MAHIFISYSRTDESLARQLAEAFSNLGAEVWLDVEDIPAGMNWSSAIQQGLRDCDLMIVIISPQSMASRNVEEEWQYYRDKNKPIVPVLWRQADVHYQLSRMQYVDFESQPFERAFKQLHSEVGRKGVALSPLRETTDKSGAIPVHPPLPVRPPPKRPPWLLGAGALLALLAVGALAWNTLNSGGTPTPTAPNIAAAGTTETPTFDVNAAIMGTQPAAAQQTVAAIPTPTPTATSDFPATVQAGLAATSTTHAEATRAAALVTPLPPTATPTFTRTSNPLQAALAAAISFSGTNADWQALYPDGFQHTFEDGVTMALVPAGCFMMGSTNSDDERPVNEQCFGEPFWIDLTEVTQADFVRLGGRMANDFAFDGEQRPVESITWFEARDFCARRGARLPIEAEWEYAARGPAEWEYPWGSWNENNAVWNRSSSQATANVGSIPAGRSWVGAFDLSGNVWEWVSSLYLPYDSQEDREANTGSSTTVRRVLRGGRWVSNDSGDLRAADRFRDDPVVGDYDFGFRCARSS